MVHFVLVLLYRRPLSNVPCTILKCIILYQCTKKMYRKKCIILYQCTQKMYRKKCIIFVPMYHENVSFCINVPIILHINTPIPKRTYQKRFKCTENVSNVLKMYQMYRKCIKCTEKCIKNVPKMVHFVMYQCTREKINKTVQCTNVLCTRILKWYIVLLYSLKNWMYRVPCTFYYVSQMYVLGKFLSAIEGMSSCTYLRVLVV